MWPPRWRTFSLKRRSWRIPLWASRSPSSLPRIRPPQTVTGEDGTRYSAQTADFLWVEDARYPEDLTLSDGTALEVWATGTQENQYRLSDGTVLLQEFPPQTDFSNDYVGNIPLSELPPPCRTASGAIIRTAVPSMT